jgi:phosphoribosylformylglycinamidine cyclo-ligase
MYQHGDYDLAGFAVGIVERDKLIDGSRVNVGDVLLGLASSGPHSNGYSLIRKIVERGNADLQQPCGATTLADALLAPTRIYVKPVLKLLEKFRVNALSHITGGGLLENLPRVLPDHTRAIIDGNSWPRPEVFNWLAAQGKVAANEMYRTFNCGIGMVLCVNREDAGAVAAYLAELGERVFHIGQIESSPDAEPCVHIN